MYGILTLWYCSNLEYKIEVHSIFNGSGSFNSLFESSAKLFWNPFVLTWYLDILYNYFQLFSMEVFSCERSSFSCPPSRQWCISVPEVTLRSDKYQLRSAWLTFRRTLPHFHVDKDARDLPHKSVLFLMTFDSGNLSSSSTGWSLSWLKNNYMKTFPLLMI